MKVGIWPTQNFWRGSPPCPDLPPQHFELSCTWHINRLYHINVVSDN